MQVMNVNGHEFALCRGEPIDMTSMHRADTAWRLVDTHGHEHRWHSGGAPAASYNPLTTYDVPSLVWVKDGEEYWEDDDEPHPVGHLECRQCGEAVVPGTKADEGRVLVAGLPWCTIDGEPVSPEEFKRRYEEATT